MNAMGSQKVFVGMSGGVDSSVAAALLKERGFDVYGIHLKCFNLDGCAEGDAEDARRAAEYLDIPFYTFDFEEEYKRDVVKYMVEGYRKGETPNPDVVCNEKIKFGLFFKQAMALGADFVATGHYVRKIKSGKDYALKVAKDKNKDQSYFLWRLTPEEIERSLFPIGDYLKPEVRRIAEKLGLHNALKKDSQGICFLGKVTLAEFLKNYIPAKQGTVVSPSGAVIGSHAGAAFYTVGERHGFTVRHRRGVGGDTKPYYVVGKDVKRNILVAVEGDDAPELFVKEITIRDVNIISRAAIRNSSIAIPIFVRVRYRQPVFPAALRKGGKKWRLIFKTSQKFVAPGQSAVFYDKKGVMLGGGIIESAL